MKKTNRGFTLIELLVVIAIIGILASIVLASLSSARTKGNDAKVEGQVVSMRNAAEIYYSTNSNYGPAGTAQCPGSPSGGSETGMFADVASGMLPLAEATTSYPTNTLIVCNSAGTAYAAQANLSSGYWCVDSTGASKKETAALGTATVCF